MSKVAITGNTSGTGVFTVASPNSNTDRVLTLPDETGTVITTAGVPASAMPAGSVLQVVSSAKTDVFSTSSTSFVDVTGLSVTITPTSTSSRILVIAGVSLGAQAGSFAIFPQLARNGSPIFRSDAAGARIRAAAMFEVAGASTFPIAINFFDTPNSVSALTYSIQVRVNAGTGRVNASAVDNDVFNWSRSASSITVMEIAG